MKTGNDVSSSAAEHQLPLGFIVETRNDGTVVISHKIWKTLLPELLIAAGSITGGCLLFRSSFQLAMLLFALAVMMLAGMWMGMQKLEFFIPGGTIIWRRGSRSGRIATSPTNSSPPTGSQASALRTASQ